MRTLARVAALAAWLTVAGALEGAAAAPPSASHSGKGVALACKGRSLSSISGQARIYAFELLQEAIANELDVPTATVKLDTKLSGNPRFLKRGPDWLAADLGDRFGVRLPDATIMGARDTGSLLGAVFECRPDLANTARVHARLVDLMRVARSPSLRSAIAERVRAVLVASFDIDNDGAVRAVGEVTAVDCGTLRRVDTLFAAAGEQGFAAYLRGAPADYKAALGYRGAERAFSGEQVNSEPAAQMRVEMQARIAACLPVGRWSGRRRFDSVGMGATMHWHWASGGGVA